MKRMFQWIAVVAAVALTVVHTGAQSGPASVLLESARQKVAIEGDLKAAIRIYQDVVSRFSKSDRPAAVNAMLSMADCYEKLGDPESARTLQRIVSEFSDQATAVAAARARLNGGMPRMICQECADALGSISNDGRFMSTAEEFYVGDRKGDIGLYDLATGKVAPMGIEGSGKDATGLPFATVFSPDDKQIVFLKVSDNPFDGLRVVSRDAPGKVRLLRDTGTHERMVPLSWRQAGILALAQKPDETLSLVMVSPADGTQKLVKAMRFNLAPAPHVASLSPDGRHVAYEQFATEPAAFVNIPQGEKLERQIRLVATDGSGDVAITTGAGVKRWATWTPNGSHVLFVSNVSGAWDLWAVAVSQGKPDGSPVLVKRNIGDVQGLGMTTAGVFHYYEGRTGVFKTTAMPIAGARPTTSPDSFVGQRPAWSPDGTRVSVSRPRADGAGGVDVVVRTMATGDERVYKKDGILGFPFMWFPDGTALLVQIRLAPNQQFWHRLDLSSGEFTKLSQQRGNPAFWTHQNIRTLSSDGRTLFFGTYSSQAESEIDRITAMDLATGNYRDVMRLPVDKESLPHAAQDIVLAANPDGRSLAVMFYDAKIDASHLATVGIDGSGYRELTPPTRALNIRNKLVWSRDGRWIYYSTLPGKDGVYKVMRIPATGGKAESAGVDVESLECFDVSPDGARIVYSTLRPEGWGELLWALDVSWLMKASR